MLSAIFSLLLSLTFAQNSIRGDHVEINLLPPVQAGGPLGVHFKIDPEWHIYWKNPGDSGAAPKFSTEDGEIKGIQWPFPKRLPVKDLTNFGYEHETVLFLDFASDKKVVELNLEWLICKIECIPGFGKFVFEPAKLSPKENSAYQKHFSQVPTSKSLANSQWKTEFIKQTESSYSFKISSEAKKNLSEIHVYPQDGLRFLTRAAQIESTDNSHLITMALSPNAGPASKSDRFTVVAKGDTTEAFDIELESIPGAIGAKEFFLALVFAFLGGIILNAMPCVFPILSLKVFGFLKDNDPTKARRSAWHYTAGVLLTFAAIGLGLTLLKFLGQSVGWGYQLQSPWLVYLLIVLFFIMALGFLGIFEMGNSLSLWAGSKSQSAWFSGSFGTGVLAVVVASPCTAPFMGSALGATLFLPWHLSLLVFLFLGLGLASPMLLLAHSSWLSQRLPKPGVWMESLKQFMAFPMLLTGLWLLWVLGNQKGPDSIYLTLFSLFGLSFVFWLWLRAQSRTYKLVLILIFLGIPATTALQIHALSIVKSTTASSAAWSNFSKDLLKEKRRTQDVFVDFTASWCITCQVNKKGVLETEEIQAIFKTANVFLIRADWTNQDAEITKALADFGRNSVPLYVFYEKGKDAKVLPEILTKEIIRTTINPKENE